MNNLKPAILNQRFLSIIKNYKRWKNQNPDTWILHSVNQGNLNDAILIAASSIDDRNRKHPHQYRLKRANLVAFGNSLLTQIDALRESANFTELIQAVRNCRVNGVGELAIYDTSVRIGAFLDIWPDQIYLHAGTKIVSAPYKLDSLQRIVKRFPLHSR